MAVNLKKQPMANEQAKKPVSLKKPVNLKKKPLTK